MYTELQQLLDQLGAYGNWELRDGVYFSKGTEPCANVTIYNNGQEWVFTHRYDKGPVYFYAKALLEAEEIVEQLNNAENKNKLVKFQEFLKTYDLEEQFSEFLELSK